MSETMDIEAPLSQSTLAAVARMDRLQDTWAGKSLLPAERVTRLRDSARVQSVASSCRLSGIRLSDLEVAAILRGQAVPLRDARDIQGYATALDFVLPPRNELLSANHLQSLHAAVVGRDPVNPSPWRTSGEYHREAFDAEGHATGRVFPALPSHLIAEKVEELLTSLEFELRTGERHPVLVIGTFVLGMHAISPFEKANSRFARVLIPLLLQRVGYDYVPCGSIEVHIEEMREAYHESYDLSQTHLWKGDANLEPWLAFFVDVLTRHRERIEARFQVEREVAAFPPLQQAILETVREHGTVDAALLMRETGANRNTLKDNLRRLVDRGALERTGERRGTRYRLA